MKDLWGWLTIAVATIAALFGASWAKRRIEARGAAKQRAKQVALAAEVERDLQASDGRIDARSERRLEAIEVERLRLSEETKEKLRRAPTADEVKRLLEESEK